MLVRILNTVVIDSNDIKQIKIFDREEVRLVDIEIGKGLKYHHRGIFMDTKDKRYEIFVADNEPLEKVIQAFADICNGLKTAMNRKDNFWDLNGYIKKYKELVLEEQTDGEKRSAKSQAESQTAKE